VIRPLGLLLLLALVPAPPRAGAEPPPAAPTTTLETVSARPVVVDAGPGFDDRLARGELAAHRSGDLEIVRLLLALAAVGGLLAGSLAAYRRLAQGPGRAAVLRARGRSREQPRWFSRWIPSAPAEADRITIVTRSCVGSRESICLVEVGHERFLIGVTASTISLLGRLDPAGREEVLEAMSTASLRRDVAAPPPSAASSVPVTATAGLEARGPEPTAADFSHELLRVAGPERHPPESTIRTALARSRDRLARLGHAR
jgi:hypothetical protein